MTDAVLDALYEARERDALPAETPMTDEEMEAMAEYFAQFCECGHHAKAHEHGRLCGSPHGCHCTRFVSGVGV